MELRNRLKALRAERGLTIFVCTPYMDEAERCNQIGLIYGGRIIASGTPTSIKAMVTGELLELTPSRFVPARELAATLDGVLEVQTYGDKLHIFVDKAAKRTAQIKAALNAQGIDYDDVRKIEVRMEEAFISLIRRQSESRSKKDTGKE